MTCRIDHIAIAAPSLEAGSDMLFRQLGARPQAGGQHPRMGTHNRLLRLGDSIYLEVIAIDPSAAPPARARWFGLDARAADAEPGLACWVARTPDIRQSLAQAPEALGSAEPMSRGALEWLISIPEDGSLPLDGVAPVLIEWRSPGHPAAGLQDQGCRLVGLELRHPEPDRVGALLRRLGVEEPGVALTVVAAPRPALVAHIDTPQGLRSIGA